MNPLRSILLLFLASAATLSAAISLPAVFSDHMVLQQDRPITVWGTADPVASVVVSFGGSEVTTKADETGKWAVALPAQKASWTGRTLTVRAANTVTFTDVLVGEVWLCSGQSNMEKPLGEKRGQRPTDHHHTEIRAADHPGLRLFQVPRHGTVTRPDFQLQWLPCTPENVEASEMSAAGYFFGRDLLANLEVPIGLIHSSFGGTRIEAWTPPSALAADPALAKTANIPYFAWVDGVQASELWASMIEPLVPYALRGFLWYQGEANASSGDMDLYTVKMRALIEGWRKQFDLPEAPFYYVQLAPFNYSSWDVFPVWMTPQALPRFWEAQTAALIIPHTGMVITTDIAGDTKDIHPTNKRAVGSRLARLALKHTYDFEDRLADSPSLEDWEITEDGSVQLRFSDVGGGLQRTDGNALSHFTVAGKNREFVPAQARLLGKDTIVVSAANVSNPVAVRFAWHETATPNLANSAGLPARPFRTDSWPVSTTRPKPDAVETLGWDAVPAILARIQPPTFPDQDFPVTAYGAKAGGQTDCTAAIREAIRACHEAGGGRVVVPNGNYRTAAIHLLSNVNLHLEEGAVLQFCTDWSAYPIVKTRYEGTECMNLSPLIYAYEQENIAVTGKGTLDGGASYETWWIVDASEETHARCNASKARLLAMGRDGVPVEERVFGPADLLRPSFIQPYHCKNVLIEGVTIVRSPMWEVHPVLSENVTVRGLKISSHGPNNDGCNPESSRDVLIEDCVFDTGDDCIAIKSGKNNDGRRVGVPSENIVIRRCVMKDGHGGVVLGSEVSGNIRNVFIEDCRMDSPNLDRALRFKSNTVRGGIVENIFMRNVEVGQTARAVLTVNFLYDHLNRGPHHPIVRNVHLENVNSSASPRVLSVVGIPEGTIDGIHFKNCTFTGITAPDIIENAGRITMEGVTVRSAGE